MPNDKKPDGEIQGDVFTVIPGEPFDFEERARTSTRREERKLPPPPGRTPRGDSVPADEILPRK